METSDILSAISAKLRVAEGDFNEVMASLMGLSEYRKTLSLRDTNVSIDKKYQKNYISYYKVRRDKDWLREYFRFMEENKNREDLTFKEVLERLSELEHNGSKGKIKSVDPSFASKMLATIDPEHFPIWDSQVAKSLEYKMRPKLSSEEKIEEYVNLYNRLSFAIGEFITTRSGQEHIKEFDIHFPQYADLSPYKKIDFYLWALGKPNK